MNSHDLARILLSKPNLPIATHANNHTYESGENRDSHGPLNVALAEGCNGNKYMLIGNFNKERFDCHNERVVEEYDVKEFQFQRKSSWICGND